MNTAIKPKDGRLKSCWSWIQDPIVQWSQDHCVMFSASIAFFAAFSLAPSLVIIIAVASIFFGADAVQGRLFGEIAGVVGADAAHGLEAIVANAWHADIATRTAIVSGVGRAGRCVGDFFVASHGAQRDLAGTDHQHAGKHPRHTAGASDLVCVGPRRGLADCGVARTRCARGSGRTVGAGYERAILPDRGACAACCFAAG